MAGLLEQDEERFGEKIVSSIWILNFKIPLEQPSGNIKGAFGNTGVGLKGEIPSKGYTPQQPWTAPQGKVFGRGRRAFLSNTSHLIR